jgi:hypothetical protein
MLLLSNNSLSKLLLATARHMVELVRIVLVPAFSAIKLVQLLVTELPVTERIDQIVAISAVEHIVALLAIQEVVICPTVEHIATGSSKELVSTAKATYLVLAVLTG